MKQIIEILKSLINPQAPDTSSKRFAGLLVIISCVIMAFIGTFFPKWVTPEFMFISLIGFAAAVWSLTLMEKGNKPDNNDKKDSDI